MRVFGQYGDALRRANSEKSPPSVTESIVNNVLGVFRSILPQVNKDFVKPCWSDGRKANVIVMGNGVLDLDTGKLTPHTPRLFAEFKLPYNFDEHAKCKLWDKTLGTMFDDRQCIDLLQEMFGTVLVGGNERRVIYLFQGASFGGKDLTADVLRAVIGETNSTAIRAAKFGGQFALWTARGKLLIVVPDVNGAKPMTAASWRP